MPSSSNQKERAVKPGDSVKVHYTCKLEDGSVFATTQNKKPLEFDVGGARIVPGLQEAVVGMKAGEKKTVIIPPEKGYGPYHSEMKATIGRELVPADIELEVGVALKVKHADGHESDAFVTAFTDETIDVDGNHPLAGKQLIMEVELLEVGG